MLVDSEEQRELLIELISSVQFSGNLKTLSQIQQRMYILIQDIKNAGIHKPEDKKESNKMQAKPMPNMIKAIKNKKKE